MARSVTTQRKTVVTIAAWTIGLLIFFIPGVIAFAVDFSTGAIYLPPDQYGLNRSKRGKEKLVTVRLPKDEKKTQTTSQSGSSAQWRRLRRLSEPRFFQHPLNCRSCVGGIACQSNASFDDNRYR